MQTSNEKRRKYLVDLPVQGVILRQTVSWWFYALVTYAAVVFIYRIVPHWLSGQGLDLQTLWYYVAPMAISSVVLLPIVLFRATRFSHRFVGPMVRFRHVLKQLSRGESPNPIKLRKNDFWVDFADDLNRVSAKFDEVSAVEPNREEVLNNC